MADVERRRGTDLLGLLFGLAAMLASAFILTDGDFWPSWLDLRWVLAGSAVLVGAGLLASSLLRNRE